jgi:hypothetical protein
MRISNNNNNNNNNVSFKYKSKLKDVATTCAYLAEPFTKNNKATVEHIKPFSRGGASTLSNYLAVMAKPNQQRGNIAFDLWLTKMPQIAKNIQDYLDKMRGIIIDGQDYVKVVVPTLNKESKGKFTFKGKIERQKYLDIIK